VVVLAQYHEGGIQQFYVLVLVVDPDQESEVKPFRVVHIIWSSPHSPAVSPDIVDSQTYATYVENHLVEVVDDHVILQRDRITASHDLFPQTYEQEIQSGADKRRNDGSLGKHGSGLTRSVCRGTGVERTEERSEKGTITVTTLITDRRILGRMGNTRDM
jgi:hypothetical protein